MAKRVSEFPKDIPILNQALQDIETLKQQVDAQQSNFGLQPYSPVLTSFGGDYTNATASGYWYRQGRMVFMAVRMVFTSVGSGTFPLLTLPVPSDTPTSGLRYTISGIEIQTQGYMWSGEVGWNNKQGLVAFRRYDNSSTPADGNIIIASGFYSAQN